MSILPVKTKKIKIKSKKSFTYKNIKNKLCNYTINLKYIKA